VISFAARRLGWALVTAFLASVVAFVLFWTIPNVDPEYWLGGGEKGNEATRAHAVKKYGLDDPLPVQYERLMSEILKGEVECFYGCRPTDIFTAEPNNLRDAFLEALPITVSLLVGAALLAIVIGVSLALVCVRNAGRWPDRLITAAATVAYSTPTLVLAALLWGFLAYKWRIFPEGDYVGLTDNPIQWFWHLLLPWIAAALPFAGAYVHVVRASLLEVVELDHVRTARAKGLSQKRVLRRHVLRNALIPPVNIWGLDFSHAFGGYALYVEVIFGLPGVGFLTAITLSGLDLPPIVALAIYLSIVVVLTSAIVDILIAYLDPRIRRSGIST
jgi:peptide/nickel transport system permease protein